MNFKYFSLVFGLLILCAVSARSKVFMVCSGDGSKEICTQMSRGSSEVNCVWVQDSIECARSIINKTIDFGMFSAESILHLGVLDWQDLSVIQPFAHKERETSNTDFESVAIVRKDHQNGFDGLKGKKYCHPGFDYNPNEKWSERFFKHFERSIVKPKCEKDKSAAEIEAAALSEFFGNSCRPGVWSYDQNEDKALKKKYSSLCKLCPKRDCKYTDEPDLARNHEFALNCLKDGGEVAYVSLAEAEKFFKTSPEIKVGDYNYLCADGSTLPIENNPNPCTWLRQPWKAVISRFDDAKEIKTKLTQWIKKGAEGVTWEAELRKVLAVEDFKPTTDRSIESPKSYISNYRNVPADETYCNTEISWCTYSELEKFKCTIARAGGISTGIFPTIKCRTPVDTAVQCLEDISRNDTDFMGIDSNYGWLARSKYNLTAALFFDTEVHQFSSIVVAVKENSGIQNFSSLRDKKACLPEYGSSPAVALINELKDRKIFNRDDCNYGALLKNFLADSCLPGAQDWKYIQSTSESFTSLCNLCFKDGNAGGNNGDLNIEIGTKNSSGSNSFNSVQPWTRATISNCAANEGNRYFGNRGTLKCLNEVGDFAVLELQSLKVHAEEVEIDENRFRILCRNNTLAKESGFEVDLDCALTTVVDGEIVMYRKSPKTSSVVHVLQALEHYFIRKNNPSFKIYNIFENKTNVLFKDSTIGLTHPDAQNQGVMVENYKKLFKDVEKCSGNSAMTISINILSTIFVVFFAYLLNN